MSLSGAPRPPSRPWHALARGALMASCLWLAGAAASQAQEPQIAEARFTDPTDRYPHNVLGDPFEFQTLEVEWTDGRLSRLTWPAEIVFEDLVPRLADVDGDGALDIIVTESHERYGARVTVYERDGRSIKAMVSTPFIGTRFRWLGIVGAADLNGDGLIEIAYVDRPHLAKTLRVWTVERQSEDTVTITEVASLPGVTNHRIGEDFISGGIRACGGAPEMIVADATWSRVLAVSWNGSLTPRDVGPFEGQASFAAALAC